MATIRHNDPQDYEEQKYQALAKWWQKKGRKATWRSLASALSKECKNGTLIDVIQELGT